MATPDQPLLDSLPSTTGGVGPSVKNLFVVGKDLTTKKWATIPYSQWEAMEPADRKAFWDTSTEEPNTVEYINSAPHTTAKVYTPISNEGENISPITGQRGMKITNIGKQTQKESPHETCALKWQDIRQSLIPEVEQELDKMFRRSQVALKQKETQMETNEYLKLQADIIAEHRRGWVMWREHMGGLLAGAFDRIATICIVAAVLYVVYSIGMYTSETERMKVTREMPTATFVLPKEG